MDDIEETSKAAGEAVITIGKTGRMDGTKVYDDGDTAAKALQQQQPLRPRVDSNSASSLLSLNIATTNNNHNNSSNTDIHHNRSTTWTLTPLSILLRTMGYMDNDTLMIMCLVCQQIKELIWSGQGMETKLIRIFELHPAMRLYTSNMNGIEVFLSNMDRYCRDGTKQRMLQGYHHWKIYDASLLQSLDIDFNTEYTARWVAPHVRMHGIVSLDLSSPGLIFRLGLFNIVGLIIPNLRKLDISNFHFDDAAALKEIARRWNRLEILKWNNNSIPFWANGRHLNSIKNLKEVYLDDCKFCFHEEIYEDDDDDNNEDDDNANDDDDDDDVSEYNAMADMQNHPNIFLFYKLCKTNPLERVSILHTLALTSMPGVGPMIGQNVLIKFVRNSPSTLVWFRSDLTTANIRMLQSERPSIQFVNEENRTL